MKLLYPNYDQGELVLIEKKLSLKTRVIINNFIKHCSITTGNTKLDKIRRVLIQISDITETDLDKLTKQKINDFTALLNNSNRAGWTKHEIKVYLKKFVKWYYKDLSLIEDVKSNKRDKEVKITEHDLITQEEFNQIIENTNGLRNKALLTLLYESGCRPQELLNLKWKDLIFEDDIVNVEFYSNKTGKTRSFPAMKSKHFLWFYKQESNFKLNDYLFKSPSSDKPLTSTSLNKILKESSKRAGIRKDVWAYVLRHTRATQFYEELSQPIAEKLLGHKNMAGVYAHISSKQAKEQLINKIYKIEKLPEEKQTELEKELQKIKAENRFIRKSLADFGNKLLEMDKQKGKVELVN